jgi:hypothetical protein
VLYHDLYFHGSVAYDHRSEDILFSGAYSLAGFATPDDTLSAGLCFLWYDGVMPCALS